jgi:hypothetical protein
MAFRAHPFIIGTNDSAPVAAYAIDAHVDVKREYNASTGEQSNVLMENTSDRMWFERDFIRVDWSQNLVTNFGFYIDQLDADGIAYFMEDGSDPADACDLQQSLDLRSTGQGTCTRVVTDGPLLEVAMYDEPDPLIPYVHRISSTRCWRDFETRG